MSTRIEFSRKIRASIIERADGKCEGCGIILGGKSFEIDHILPAALGGTATQSNGRLLCIPCHREKTVKDVRRIRKADRQRDKHTGAICKAKWPMQRRYKQKIDGTVVDRTTGNIVGDQK